ncbi:MAG: hypothetical protein GVY32_10725 [Gammaproteobacteria bacterium]|jgi:hypothetical protein|nr:hypothetical protein [Gammaproteobacteria bacterium]
MKALTILLATLFATSALGEATFSWNEFTERAAAAVQGGEQAALIELQAERRDEPVEPREWNAYWRAYLHYRAAYLAGEDEPDKERLEACVETAEQAVESGEDSGESHALLGLCYGQLAGTGMMAGMRYGSKAQAALDEALLLAPDNPRVLLAAGINDLYTPAQYGGDIERAERRLSDARDRLAGGAEHVGESPWRPAWGALDAHGHLAMAYARLERPGEALEVLRQAERSGIQSPWLEGMRSRFEGDASSR